MKPPKRQRKAVTNLVIKEQARTKYVTTKWSLKDKKRLLSALKKVRSSEDYTVIQKFLKKKTVPEIQQYVTWMKKRAANFAGKNVGKDEQAERTPIEVWLDTCRDLTQEVPPECLQAFSQVMTVAAAEPANLEEPGNSPDYPAIYNYLSCLIKDAPPPTLSPLDSAVVLDLLQSLADRLKTIDLTQMKAWLQTRYHDLKKSFIPERTWDNPFKLTEEDLSLFEPQSNDQKDTKDSEEQTSSNQQTTETAASSSSTNPPATTSTSQDNSTEASTASNDVNSKSSTENMSGGPSTSTVEPSTSSTIKETEEGDGKQTSHGKGTKEAEEIICLNPLLIPARYLSLENLSFEKESEN